jgi:hypothetical protein
MTLALTVHPIAKKKVLWRRYTRCVESSFLKGTGGTGLAKSGSYLAGA